MKLTPLSLNAPGLEAKSLAEMRWRGAGGWGGWTELVPAWEGTDILVAPGHLLMIEKERVKDFYAEPMAAEPEVVFDGKYLWASFPSPSRMVAFDQDGTEVIRVTEADGLPRGRRRIPMLPTEPGRILAAGGCFTDHVQTPSWVATVEIWNGKGKVKLLLTANKPWPEAWPVNVADKELRFDPDWIVGHEDATGRNWAFISRERIQPLVVDLATLEVTAYPVERMKDPDWFPRLDPPKRAFLSYGGRMYIACSRHGFKVLEFDSKTKRMKIQSQYDTDKMSGLYAGNAILDEGWMWIVGEAKWLRRNIKTGMVETLVKERRSLPGFGSGRVWKMQVSNAYGLVAWQGGELFHVGVAGE
ncbi:MAG: hypothetical protein WD042_12670 [Phycisphaeraceae bacterium]